MVNDQPEPELKQIWALRESDFQRHPVCIGVHKCRFREGVVRQGGRGNLPALDRAVAGFSGAGICFGHGGVHGARWEQVCGFCTGGIAELGCNPAATENGAWRNRAKAIIQREAWWIAARHFGDTTATYFRRRRAIWILGWAAGDFA